MFESAVNNVKNILSDMTLNEWNSRPECSQVLSRLNDCPIDSLVLNDRYYHQIMKHFFNQIDANILDDFIRYEISKLHQN